MENSTTKETPVTSEENKSYEHAQHWAEKFLKEFAKESDRAAVIVTASIFDNSLSNLLLQHLVPNHSSNDELFDGANAPLASFSAKIAMSHRIGLISGHFARNLHLIRRIRNEFAHNIHGCSFEDSAIKSRVLELYKSQNYKSESLGSVQNAKGSRGDFFTVCLWMIWHLNCQMEKTKALAEANLEFGFTSHD
jgi:hypothetical protein